MKFSQIQFSRLNGRDGRGMPPPPLLPAPHQTSQQQPEPAADIADLDDGPAIPLASLLDQPPAQTKQPERITSPTSLAIIGGEGRGGGGLQQQPTEVWDLPPVNNPMQPNRPHYRIHPRPSTIPQQPESAEKWRIPTILVLTLTITLGVAMIIFLTWILYRKIKQLRELRRQELMERQEMSMRI